MNERKRKTTGSRSRVRTKAYLAKTALSGTSFDRLPVGMMGGRLASISETYAVPDEHFFNESEFREDPKIDK